MNATTTTTTATATATIVDTRIAMVREDSVRGGRCWASRWVEILSDGSVRPLRAGGSAIPRRQWAAIRRGAGLE
jgi:hypothetical protein